MTKRGVVVPDGMLKAANYLSREADASWGDMTLEGILEAALLWLIENPIVPSNRQMQEVLDTIFVGPENLLDPKDAVVEWQRRMFLAPELEVPEAIKPVLDRMPAVLSGFGLTEIDALKQLVLESYLLGKEGK